IEIMPFGHRRVREPERADGGGRRAERTAAPVIEIGLLIDSRRLVEQVRDVEGPAIVANVHSLARPDGWRGPAERHLSPFLHFERNPGGRVLEAGERVLEPGADEGERGSWVPAVAYQEVEHVPGQRELRRVESRLVEGDHG